MWRAHAEDPRFGPTVFSIKDSGRYKIDIFSSYHEKRLPVIVNITKHERPMV